ncbi:MAG: chemotaxis protein CheA [Gammaproteobacteria bacterium]
MGIDLSQFHQVFFEESFEGLDVMEELLLTLNDGDPDTESINTIFRSAHSIKGGSATFGFASVAEFTHILESLLDDMRDGNRDVTSDAVDLLLQSVDCLRDMLTSLQDTGECDASLAESLGAQFRALEGGEALPESSDDASEEASEASAYAATGQWKITFKPEPHILHNGNEPVRMFRELSMLGDLSVTVIKDTIPTWGATDPEEIFLHWEMTLDGSVAESDIDEVFEWVIDECELSVTREGTDDASQSSNTETDDAPAQDNVATLKPAASDEPETLSTSTAVAKKPQPKKEVTRSASSIRVDIDKVDSLINLVGELVITQSMLSQVGTDFHVRQLEVLKHGLTQLEQNTRELQERVMQIRMMPISFAFNRFPRMVRDLAKQLDKKVELVISGESTELDKTVMEQIGDPLVHLVRNSMDHGIESPEERVALGKPEVGTVKLDAFHQGGTVMIEITDDGKGIDASKVFAKAVEKGIVSASDNLPEQEIFKLLFEPGFSTAETVSDVSGRGVGMDVVKRNITNLGGSVDVYSELGKGSTFSIRLPLTLAILDGQLIRIGKQIFVVPLISVSESIQVDSKLINRVGGEMDLYQLREEYVPIINMAGEFHFESDNKDIEDSVLVVVEGEDQKIGLQVDELLEQQQVVIKSLEENYKSIQGISGATILGDGRVALIIDVVGFIRGAKHYKRTENDSA